jgi:hypothetical protein
LDLGFGVLLHRHRPGAQQANEATTSMVFTSRMANAAAESIDSGLVQTIEEYYREDCARVRSTVGESVTFCLPTFAIFKIL